MHNPQSVAVVSELNLSQPFNISGQLKKNDVFCDIFGVFNVVVLFSESIIRFIMLIKNTVFAIGMSQYISQMVRSVKRGSHK